MSTNIIKSDIVLNPKNQFSYNGTKISSIRDSNFEALRIIAMFCIILYHLLLYFVDPLSDFQVIFKAVQIPLHIGVVLFVLISGFYTIKPSLKGALLLLIPVFLYYTPVELIYSIQSKDINKAFNSLLFFSYSPYWYVRTYFYLYITSPIINYFIKHANTKEINVITALTLVVSCWVGINKGDLSLEGGKNLLYFISLYLLGNRIRHAAWGGGN